MGECLRRQAAVHVSLDLALSAALIASRGSPSFRRFHKLGVLMTRHMIWAEDENFTGWCCSHCPWGVVAPRLESTVAALAFNRVAQEGFDRHGCAQNTRPETAS